jgi:uncharacterized protein
VSEVLKDRLMVKQRQVRPGMAEAVELREGELLQIIDVDGKQVADCVVFASGDQHEWGSTAVTRSSNENVMLTMGKQFWSNRRRPLLELVEDTVGRHDILYACCDPVRYEKLGAPDHANCRTALAEALTPWTIGRDRVPDPINWFMNVAIKQRGELEIREPLSEADDYVVVKALTDVIVAVSACPQDLVATNGMMPTNIAIRVYR